MSVRDKRINAFLQPSTGRLFGLPDGQDIREDVDELTELVQDVKKALGC
jgi:hypothetical protein